MDIPAFEKKLAATDSLEELLALMQCEFATIGITQPFIYIFQIIETYKTPPCVCLTTFSSDFLEVYMANNYALVDPLFRHYSSSTLPYFWSIEDDWSHYGPGTLEFQSYVRGLGYKGGVCIPVFTKEGTRGFLAYNVDRHDAVIYQQAAQAAFLNRYFHHHVLNLWVRLHPGQTSLRARLTPRETEILLLLSDGMTSQEIAGRLLLAKRTVDLHIMNVQEKLQAENRQQALCKAGNLGLLQPDLNYGIDDVTWVLR